MALAHTLTSGATSAGLELESSLAALLHIIQAAANPRCWSQWNLPTATDSSRSLLTMSMIFVRRIVIKLLTFSLKVGGQKCQANHHISLRLSGCFLTEIIIRSSDVPNRG